MRSLHLCWYFNFSICKIPNVFNAYLCMHPQSNTINLLMLAEQFVYYLDVGWKANFDCCLDTNPNSIWQCLSPSRTFPFCLCPLNMWLSQQVQVTKELQHRGHQQETGWTGVISIFPQAWVKTLFGWGLQSARVNLKSQPWGSAHGDSNQDFNQYLFIQASSKQDDYI